MILSPRGWDWASLYALLLALNNRCFNNALLAVGTTTTRVKTTNACTYSLAGQLYSKAATDPVDNFNAAQTNTGVGQFSKLRVEIDSAGVVTARQGAMASSQAAAPVPPRSESKCTLGWIEIPASFTFGTTAYNAAGVAFRQGDPDLADGRSLLPANRGMTTTVLAGF